MLGLAVDMQPFYDLARDNAVIGPLVERFSGVRPPRFPTVFEGLVNSIACQQVTLDLGILLLNRLSERFGVQVATGGTVLHAFPTPADLADVQEESIRELGFSRQKARAMKELSTHVADNSVDLARLEGMTNREAIADLSHIRGIGRWSAEYVLLRGLGRLDIFPGDDIGAQNNLQRLFHLTDKPAYDHIRQLTSPWHPYEGVVYFHLLLDKLRMNGAI
jgi:DNA-3-methyladenine glycosylase II